MEAYAKAKAAMVEASVKAQSDPMAAQLWPITASAYQQTVDDAWDSWMSADKDEIEHALAIIESQPNNPSS